MSADLSLNMDIKAEPDMEEKPVLSSYNAQLNHPLEIVKRFAAINVGIIKLIRFNLFDFSLQ
jgi:hypothetical protein